MAIPETIIIEIDDVELETAIATLRPVTGQLEKIQYQLGTTDLPSINRNLRIILSRIPGMRVALRLYTRLEQTQLGIARGGIHPYMAVLTTLLVLYREISMMMKKIERREKDYEMMVRRYRGFSHDEYESEMERWKLYNRSIPP